MFVNLDTLAFQTEDEIAFSAYALTFDQRSVSARITYEALSKMGIWPLTGLILRQMNDVVTD